MTENTTTAPDATTDENQASAPARDTLDVLSNALLSAAEPKMDELKKIAARQASVGDVGKLLSEAIENSDDVEVAKRRAAVEKANEAINRLTKEMEEIVKPSLKVPSDEELEEMELKYKVLASEINSFNAAFMVETSKAFEGLTVFDYLGELPGKRRGAKAGQGTGSVRPRVSSIEYTKDVNSEDYTKAEKNGKSTFTVLSQIVKDEIGATIGAGEFAEAWTSQNGVKVQDWAELPEVTTFIYSQGDDEGNTHQYKIRVTR